MNGVILSVEDDNSAYLLIRMAISELGKAFTLFRAVNGADGLAFLRREGKHKDAPRPHLVLANINMPKMDGIQLLAAIKSDPALAGIPVVMFTSSSLDADRARCLALGAKEFLTKPNDLDDWVRAVHSVCALAASA